MGSDHRSRLPGFPPLTEDHANILVSTKQSTCLLTAAFVTYWEDEVSSIVCIKSVANNRQASEFICTSNMCLQGDTIITHSIITVLRVTPLLLTVSILYSGWHHYYSQYHHCTPYTGWHHYYPQYHHCTQGDTIITHNINTAHLTHHYYSQYHCCVSYTEWHKKHLVPFIFTTTLALVNQSNIFFTDTTRNLLAVRLECMLAPAQDYGNGRWAHSYSCGSWQA